MKSTRHNIDRRTFIKGLAVTTTAVQVVGKPHVITIGKPRVWQIGCFNRPWTKWSYDVTLDSIVKGGFKLSGLLTRTHDEPFVGSEATPEYLRQLHRRLTLHRLTANVAALRIKEDSSFEESRMDLRRQIDNAKFLSLEYLMTFGTDQPDNYERFGKLMIDAAGYAESQGLQLVLKPHGGISATGNEMRRCLETVNHANFKIWYDPGNIIYYAGKDPLEELKPIARYVTGLCAKDCTGQKGKVEIQFGSGKVNFKEVLHALKAVGFKGPIMIECCAPGSIPDEVTQNVLANKRYLEQVMHAI